MRKGKPESEAIAIARGILNKAAKTGRWSKGKAGAKTRAGAKVSLAQRKDFSNTDLAFSPLELRDADGKWTKGETRSWLKTHPVDHKNIMSMYDQATAGEKATGESWYPNAHKIAAAMGKSHGVSTRTAAGVIAAYSPQTPWGKNLMEANEVLRTHKGVGGKGAHLDIVRTPNDTNESRYGVMASGINHKRAQALLAGQDFENVFGGKRNKSGDLPPHSLKVRAFGELIANGGQTDPHRTRVVVDRHAAGVARGVRLTEQDYAIDGPSSSKRKYKEYADAYRKAAEELSKREGKTITPEALQATTWLTRQRLNNTEAPNGRKSLGNRDESESLNYFASYEPNIADVIGHPMTGYAELSKVRLKDTDLAFNPSELRGPDGRWLSAFQKVAHRLNMEASKDGGPDRAAMPQLSGVPKPGSKADKMFPGRAPGSEVDLTQEFEKWLGKQGVAVEHTEVPSSALKPTQDQLIEPKVIGIAKYMQHAPKDSPVFEPIFTSGDNHVIDGHHRWAGNEVRNEVEGVPRWMKIRKMKTDLPTSLRLATQFMDEYGLPRAGMNDTKTVSTFAKQPVSLSVYTLKDIDLTRHVRTPAGVEKYHLPIGSPIGGGSHSVNDIEDLLNRPVSPMERLNNATQDKAALRRSLAYPPNPMTVSLNNEDVPLDRAVSMVGGAYGWPTRDSLGSSEGDAPSIKQQDKAQIVARVWYSTTDTKASALWQEYQSPQVYGRINAILRGGKPQKGEPSRAQLQKHAKAMFEGGGYTTTEPMTVYRALKSNIADGQDWAKQLKPGTTFTDQGLVSTTAHSKFSEGWLMGDSEGNDSRLPAQHDVVVELHLPTGTRIVGGDPQFIETMLPPGTSFKVKSAEQVTSPAVNPLDDRPADLTYTHVVAEVQ